MAIPNVAVNEEFKYLGIWGFMSFDLALLGRSCEKRVEGSLGRHSLQVEYSDALGLQIQG